MSPLYSLFFSCIIVAPVYILYNILINIVLTDNNNRAPRTTESYSQEAQMNPSNTGSSMRGDLLNVFRLLFLAAKLIFFHIPLVIFYHIPRYIYQTVHDIVVTLYNVYCAVCFIVDSTQTMLYYVYYALCNLCRISYFLLYALRLSVFDNLSYIILYAVYFSFQTFYYTLLVISAVLAFYHAFYFSQQQN